MDSDHPPILPTPTNSIEQEAEERQKAIEKSQELVKKAQIAVNVAKWSATETLLTAMKLAAKEALEGAYDVIEAAHLVQKNPKNAKWPVDILQKQAEKARNIAREAETARKAAEEVKKTKKPGKIKKISKAKITKKTGKSQSAKKD